MILNTVRFKKKVYGYYHKNGRIHLPWRKTRNPYKILVAEVMLQQTQVDRVIPYYKSFLKQFPNIEILAKARLGDVLKVWSGLGYNRRAKFLHDAVKATLIYESGKIPRTYEALRTLPGVGEYTAKAVRVFAFDKPEVMLETNIRTALIHEFFPQGRMVSDKKLIPILETCLTHTKSPRVWYWALMDYGAYIKKEHGNATRKSKTYTKQKPFKGSQREVRGAVLKECVGRKRKPTVRHLAHRTGFSQIRVKKAMIALTSEGLVWELFLHI